MTTRRHFLRTCAAVTAGLPFINRGRFALWQGGPQYSARAIDLMKRATVIDMLSPLTLNFPLQGKWFNDPESFAATDAKRYLDSGIHVFHIAIGMGGPDAYNQTLQFIGQWNGLIAGNDHAMMRIDSAADFDRVKGSGKIGILLGLQNSDHFQRPEHVDTFFNLGQRVSQLTYNSRNWIGNGSTERRDDGLSDYGVRIVQRMNQVGMAVDVSHSGDRTTLDAFEASSVPVLITHSNCRALAPGHPRCKTDEAIRAMAAKGGVMGITGVRMFVKVDEPTTVEHVLDHFDHVRKLVGPQHLGVGSDIDLDGYDDMPPELNRRLRAGYKGSYGFREKIDVEGLDHPRRMYDLTDGLIRRKYSDDEILGVLGGNFKRVLSQIWGARKVEKS
jgi:membrane dipeptidase